MNRVDGYHLKNVDPMYRVACHVMDKRYDAMNMVTIDIPLDPIKAYLKDAKRRGHNLSHLAVIIAAYVRVISEFPGLNRFIMNKEPYAHKEIKVAMVVLKDGSMEDHGTMSKVTFEPTDTIFQVEEKMAAYIQENRTSQDNGTEKLVRFFTSLPGLLRFGVPLVKWMDRHNILPKTVVDFSPFHATLLITNLASIRTNHIFHHVYEFGTTSVGMALGNPRYVTKMKQGEVVFERCMPIGVVMDERIASGSYFALAFRRLRHYLEDPTTLETPPEKVNYDS
ncbi:MAG: hypothetical protein IJ412_02130 [Oscillospiraceae bacterium]|nr:hypothetical protein [Oscillospiraceae bacterium]